MNSVAITERIAKLATESMKTGQEAEEFTSGLVRQAARLVVEQMLEAEVAEMLGRQRYARRDSGQADAGPVEPGQANGGPGYRNEHETGTQLVSKTSGVPVLTSQMVPDHLPGLPVPGPPAALDLLHMTGSHDHSGISFLSV